MPTDCEIELSPLVAGRSSKTVSRTTAERIGFVVVDPIPQTQSAQGIGTVALPVAEAAVVVIAEK